jgi:hypothetical protein
MKKRGATVSSRVIIFCFTLVLTVACAGLLLQAQGIERPVVDKDKVQRRVPPPALAPIINARITECSGGTVGPARLVLKWSYGSGVRPDKVRIDVQREGEGSVLVPAGIVIEVSGTETTKEVRIFRLWGVPYTMIFTAEYPPWGTRIYTFTKRCAE